MLHNFPVNVIRMYVPVDLKVGLKTRGRYFFAASRYNLRFSLLLRESVEPTCYAVVILLITYGINTAKREI